MLKKGKRSSTVEEELEKIRTLSIATRVLESKKIPKIWRHLIRAEEGEEGEEGESDSDSEGLEPLFFLASSAGEKADGWNLTPENWRTDVFEKNPVFLWSHDYWGSRPPIGRAEITQDKEGLWAKVEIDPEDEFAVEVHGKYARKFLNAVSVGWDFVDEDGKAVYWWEEDFDAEEAFYRLLDLSGVNVPGDPDALIQNERSLKLAAARVRSLIREEGLAGPEDDDGEPVPAEVPEEDEPEGREAFPLSEILALLVPFAEKDELDQARAILGIDFQALETIDDEVAEELRGQIGDLRALIEGGQTRKGAKFSRQTKEQLQRVAGLLEDALGEIEAMLEENDEEEGEEEEGGEGAGKEAGNSRKDSDDDLETFLATLDERLQKEEEPADE